MNKFAYLLIIIFVTISCSREQTVIIDEQISNKTELGKLDSADTFTYSECPLGTAPPKYKGHKADLIVVRTWKHEKQLQNERHALLKSFY